MSTYSIPVANLAGLQAKFAKLAKRADRIGVPAPAIELGERSFVPERTELGIETGRDIEMVAVTVTGESPMYDGWHLTAVIELDHAEPDSPNVVGVVPGTPDAETHVEEWRAMSERCDHCGVNNRRRNKLVVVTHEDGEQKVVGSTCLKDFLGSISPDAIASWAQVLADLDDVVNEFTEGGTGEYRYDPITFLAWVVRSISESGWVSRGNARFGDRTATADDAVSLAEEYRKQGGRMVGRTERGRYIPPVEPLTEAEVAEAEAAWAWAGELDPGSNDYLLNVNAVAQKQSLRSKHLGIAASIVSSRQRELGRLAERAAREAAGKASEFVGQVKERIELAAEVVFVRYFDGDWGTKALVKMVDADGNLLVWWASDASNAPERGDRVEGKATVKEHSLYEGVKQTTVTRAKLEVISGPSPLACGDPVAHAYGTCSCTVADIEAAALA